MSAENKTITDIVAEKRHEAKYLIESAEASAQCGETMAGTPYTEENLEFARQDAKEMLAEADRLEAAMKREVDALHAQIEDLRKQIAGVVVSKNATTTKESLGVGNAAKLRKAVKLALSLLDLGKDVPSKAVKREDIDFMKAALSASPRNCDVGTAEEQGIRLRKFCVSQKWCDRCPLRKSSFTTHTDCKILWAQLPYEKGENDGSK